MTQTICWCFVHLPVWEQMVFPLLGFQHPRAGDSPITDSPLVQWTES